MFPIIGLCGGRVLRMYSSREPIIFFRRQTPLTQLVNSVLISKMDDSPVFGLLGCGRHQFTAANGSNLYQSILLCFLGDQP
jgi:hypothetical protein